MQDLFKNLSLSKSKPAILSLVSPYNLNYKPKSIQNDFPQVLSELYDPDCLEHNYMQLLQQAKLVAVEVNKTQQENVEQATRRQSNSRLWFRFRAGRITASKMYSVLHTNTTMPSVSLIKDICYPEAHKFTTNATKWGCNHEQEALDIYDSMMKSQHRDFQMSNCGFVISMEYPFIGASPDSFVNCSCCGEGCVEVKCPYCKRDYDLDDAAQDPKFCLQSAGDSDLKLKENHAYYAQVQTQMNVCGRKYCDFFVFTEKGFHCERIICDSSLWEEYVMKAEMVFRNGVLPQIIGKCFTRVPKYIVYDNDNSSQHCYCNGNGTGEMFACSKSNCVRKFFHLACLNLKHVLKKKWVCPDCRNCNMKPN